MTDVNVLQKRDASYYKALVQLFDVAQGDEVSMSRHDGHYVVRLKGKLGEGDSLGGAAAALLLQTHPQGTAGEIVDGLFDLFSDLQIKKGDTP